MGRISKMGLGLSLFGSLIVLSVWYFAFYSQNPHVFSSVGQLLWATLLGAITLLGAFFVCMGLLILLV
ncbi:MAG: hypothetical protein WC792_05620 [Candidatus Micrarchaeia archaeon]